MATEEVDGLSPRRLRCPGAQMMGPGALTDDGNALIAIGSAAGGAVVGLLSPVRKKPDGQG